jgi:guanine deaminase
VDTHTHAPQYANIGLGLDLPLLEWLERYTFPTESKFIDTELAARIYTAAVTRHVRCGTTTCCYFATIHLDATKRLCDIIESIGQRAFIGKVNMDQHAPDGVRETAAQSLKDTRDFIQYVRSKQSSVLTPILTPRFVPSCTPELLEGLAKLAKEFQLPIQSHLSENVNECKWVGEMFPDIESYTEVYDAFGLLTSQTIMAHGIYLSLKERRLLAQVHCCVNTRLIRM